MFAFLVREQSTSVHKYFKDSVLIKWLSSNQYISAKGLQIIFFLFDFREYYFSEQNLQKDIFLRRQVNNSNSKNVKFKVHVVYSNIKVTFLSSLLQGCH